MEQIKSEIAVLAERCEDLEKRNRESEERLSDAVDKVEARLIKMFERMEQSFCAKIEKINQKTDNFSDQAKTARGGIIVLAGMGALLAWVFDVVGKAAKLWSH